MTESITEYPRRAWIPADESFEGQADGLREMVPRIAGQLRDSAPRRPERVSLIGIGASHAAAGSATYALRAAGVDAARFLPSELPERAPVPGDLVVLISQSGRSAEVVDIATRVLDDRRFAVTNYAPSPLGDLAGSGLTLGNLDDSSVSFVSFTGTMLALGMLAESWAGSVDEAHWLSVIDRGQAATERADAQLREIADVLVSRPSVDFVAPAQIASVAEEAALMFREGPRIVATSMETRLYLHGPMDAAGDTAHVVFGGAREALLIDQLSERSTTLVAVTGEGGPKPSAPGASVIELPVPLDDGIGFSIAATFVAQRLTLLAAQHRGIDINEAVFTRLDTKVDQVAAR